MRRANYVVEQTDPLTIRDVGPWDRYLSVTNAAEEVVEELVARGAVGREGEILYYDSEGHLDKLLVSDGQFMGFAPGRDTP